MPPSPSFSGLTGTKSPLRHWQMLILANFVPFSFGTCPYGIFLFLCFYWCLKLKQTILFSHLCCGWGRALQIPRSQTPQKREFLWSLESLHSVCYLKSSWFVQTFLFMSRGKAQFPLHLALWMYDKWIVPHPLWRILERKFSSRCFGNKTPKLVNEMYQSPFFSLIPSSQPRGWNHLLLSWK